MKNIKHNNIMAWSDKRENETEIVCRGEIFGTVGYVGREHTAEVKGILDKCEVYRIDMVDEESVGEREISLIVSWN